MLGVATATPPNVPRTLTRTSPPRRIVRAYSEDNFGEILFIPSVSTRSHRTLLVLRHGTPLGVSEHNFMTPSMMGRRGSQVFSSCLLFPSVLVLQALVPRQPAVKSPRNASAKIDCLYFSTK